MELVSPKTLCKPTSIFCDRACIFIVAICNDTPYVYSGHLIDNGFPLANGMRVNPFQLSKLVLWYCLQLAFHCVHCLSCSSILTATQQVELLDLA
ncbi:hypothetical protein MRB53_004140 [Persea americana]|uniref:Uncharacterized protein n=1 Tax=Persea americana TaxID=3435 RepID=A0ACC2MZ78_PERAE|nr:hypothetical protein MRB53_004140 [Persea americana]